MCGLKLLLSMLFALCVGWTDIDGVAGRSQVSYLFRFYFGASSAVRTVEVYVSYAYLYIRSCLAVWQAGRPAHDMEMRWLPVLADCER